MWDGRTLLFLFWLMLILFMFASNLRPWLSPWFDISYSPTSLPAHVKSCTTKACHKLIFACSADVQLHLAPRTIIAWYTPVSNVLCTAVPCPDIRFLSLCTADEKGRSVRYWPCQSSWRVIPQGPVRTGGWWSKLCSTVSVGHPAGARPAAVPAPSGAL